jgi:hypothetical protein
MLWVISCLNDSFCRENNNLVLSIVMVVVCKVIVKIIGLGLHIFAYQKAIEISDYDTFMVDIVKQMPPSPKFVVNSFVLLD